MSSCIVLQQQNNVFVASDTAISSMVNGERVRLSNSAKKVFRKKNDIIFCSGNMEIANKCKNYIEQAETLDIEEIQKFVSLFYIDGMFEIFIAKVDTKGNVETYQLSSYNNFEPIKRLVSQGNTEIFAIGYHTKEMLSSFEKFLYSSNVIDSIVNSFIENVCVEIGGNVDLIYYHNNMLHEKTFYLNDNIKCLVTMREAKFCDFVIADTLIGKVILGESLFIGNENNTLKIMPEGIYVYDNDASHELRVFIGIDEKDNKAKMALYSSTGDKSLVLSEEGIYNCYQISDRDSFDYYKPFETYFFIPSNLQKTFEARLIIDLQKFRSYSKSSGSTKINLTTTGGSGSIDVSLSGVSGSAGGTTVSGSGTSGISSIYRHTTTAPYGSSNGDQGNIEMGSHYHWVDTEHTHAVSINMGSHSHGITVSGSASASSHTHGITMPSHEHNLVYGIYETDYFPTCEVYVGELKVATLNSQNRYANIDITSQFSKLASGSHKISIKTPNKQELGRASFTLFWSGFYNYN